MTTFNDTSLLKRAIESLRHLPFDDWEMLILDNSNESEEPFRENMKADLWFDRCT